MNKKERRLLLLLAMRRTCKCGSRTGCPYCNEVDALVEELELEADPKGEQTCHIE